MKRTRTARTTARDYPRTARLNHLLHEIIAEEIERLDDERLGFLTVIAVEVEPDLRHAVVYYSSLDDELPDGAGGGDRDDSASVTEALADHRTKLQAAVARQARLKRTPELAFKRDDVTRTATRIEGLLREVRGPDEEE